MSQASALRLLLLSMIWGSSFVFYKIAAADMAPAFMAALRVAFGALFLGGLFALTRKQTQVAKRWKLIAVIAVFASALPFTLVAYASFTVTASVLVIINAGKPDKNAVSNFNEAVNTFNLQADQLNADKAEFEKESSTYDNWVSNTLKPACNKVVNKPVNPVTSYYACGFNGTQPLADVPHCKTLPKLDVLKDCIQKAGSKAKAQESCPPNY